MRTGVFLFGGVEMDDAGAGPPAPTDRRFSQEECWRATERLVDLGVLADQLGYDTFWLTEHHFQHEGYEVVPNGILFGRHAGGEDPPYPDRHDVQHRPPVAPAPAGRGLRHLHNISGGRAILGVGRGTVPREAESLGTAIGSFDNPEKADADTQPGDVRGAVEVSSARPRPRDVLVQRQALHVPSPGIPDRGGCVEHLTLVPRPRHPYEWWQAVTSPPTLEAVPRGPQRRVLAEAPPFIKRRWDRYAELWAETTAPS